MENRTLRSPRVRQSSLRNLAIRRQGQRLEPWLRPLHNIYRSRGLKLLLGLVCSASLLLAATARAYDGTRTGSPLNLDLPTEDTYDWASRINDNFSTINSSYSTIQSSVTSIFAGTSGAYLPLTGGTMTGSLLMLSPSTITIQGAAFSVGSSTLVVTGGKVGIRTSSPKVPLDINGGMRFYGDDFPTTGHGTEMLFDGTNSIIQSYDRDASQWINSRIDGKVLILNSQSVGNVGIGTLSPDSLLDVNGSVVARSTLTINGSAFSVGGSTLVVSGGNVGIGTDLPTTKLDVNGNAQFGSGVTKSTFSTTGALTMASGAAITGNLTGNVTGNATTVSPAGVNLSTITTALAAKMDDTGDTITGVYALNNNSGVALTLNKTAGSETVLDITGSAGLTGIGASVYVGGNAGKFRSRDNTAYNLYTADAANNITHGFLGNGGAELNRIASTHTVSVGGNSFTVGASTLIVAGGNVGIGATAPSDKLTVSSGAVRVDGTSASLTVVGGSVTANAFFGGGAGITGVVADVVAAAGVNLSTITTALAAKVDDTGDSITGAYTITNNSGVPLTISKTAGSETILSITQSVGLTGNGIDVYTAGDPAKFRGRSNTAYTLYTADAANNVTHGFLGNGTVELNRIASTHTVSIGGTSFTVGTSTLVVSSGKVGIGATAPSDKLTISSGTVRVDGTSAGVTVVGGSVTASAFFGDGASVTNVAAASVGTAGVNLSTVTTALDSKVADTGDTITGAYTLNNNSGVALTINKTAGSETVLSIVGSAGLTGNSIDVHAGGNPAKLRGRDNSAYTLYTADAADNITHGFLGNGGVELNRIASTHTVSIGGNSFTVGGATLVVTGGAITGAGQPGAFFYRSTNYSVPDVTYTDLNFNSGNYLSVGGMFTASVATVSAAGVYSIRCGYVMGANATGVRDAIILVNGSAPAGFVGDENNPSGTNATRVASTVIAYPLAANDKVSCQAYQSSGITLTISSAYFQIQKLW